MNKLSKRLTRELMQNGNPPISPDGLVRLRPDLAADVAEAQVLLADEIKHEIREADDPHAREIADDVLEARFLTNFGNAEQLHLFMLGPKAEQGSGYRIRRWSKMPVSYGSFVQVERFLEDAWGDVSRIELRRSSIRLLQ